MGVHVFVSVFACIAAVTASYEIRACHGNKPWWKKRNFALLKISLSVKAQAINGNIAADEAYFI